MKSESRNLQFACFVNSTIAVFASPTRNSRKRRKYFEVSCSLDNIATSSLRALAILHLRCLRNTSNTSIILKLRGLRDLRNYHVFYANHANTKNINSAT